MAIQPVPGWNETPLGGDVTVPDDRTTRELALAALAGVAGLAGSYAIAGGTRAFVLAPIDALIVSLTPGGLVAWLIDNVGAEAHVLHLGLAAAIAVGLLGLAARAGLRVARVPGPPMAGVLLAGLLAWASAWAITGRIGLALGAGLPVAAVVAVGVLPRAVGETDPSRRRVLAAGVAALGAVGVVAAVERVLPDPGAVPSDAPIPGGDDPELQRLLDEADERSLDVADDDLPGLVSDVGSFYNVDIASFDPQLDAEDWSVSITGEVAESVTVDFDELVSMPIEHRHTTLRCVGEPLNGHKLDNAVWTGTPIRPLLERADPGGDCNCAMLYAEDDYFVQFPVAALADAFLAWGMNGQPLPRSHGHPVRLLVPGHWGETNVKWLEEIELLNEELDGYWEQRGWHGTGPVRTVAKLWAIEELGDGRTEVAGHAYAGTRGVDRVEVSVDGGETWTEATLSEPLPGDDVWRQWRHRFRATGSHEVVVRAVDGTGAVQPREEFESFPTGASGWVSRQI